MDSGVYGTCVGDSQPIVTTYFTVFSLKTLVWWNIIVLQCNTFP